MQDSLAQYFKAEAKSQGAALQQASKVSISSHTDTCIQAYIRASTPAKVTLQCDELLSPNLQASCTCPAGKKNRHCKHIWATLLQTEEMHSEFLSHKNTLDHGKPPSSELDDATSTPAPTYQETAKIRASAYRKEQYQKQKAMKKGRDHKPKNAIEFAPELQAALDYFEQNGFPMPNGPDASIVAEAKRKLSRFFHPDRGGTHEEAAELNDRCDVILRNCQ